MTVKVNPAADIIADYFASDRASIFKCIPVGAQGAKIDRITKRGIAARRRAFRRMNGNGFTTTVVDPTQPVPYDL